MKRIFGGRDDLELNGSKETKGSIGPGDGMEQFVLGGDPHNLTRGDNNLVCNSKVVEETSVVRRCLNSITIDETTDSELIKLRDHREGVTTGEKVIKKLEHVNRGLHLEDSVLGVEFKDIREITFNSEKGLLVQSMARRDSHPSRTSSAHSLLLSFSSPLSHTLLNNGNTCTFIINTCVYASINFEKVENKNKERGEVITFRVLVGSTLDLGDVPSSSPPVEIKDKGHRKDKEDYQPCTMVGKDIGKEVP